MEECKCKARLTAIQQEDRQSRISDPAVPNGGRAQSIKKLLGIQLIPPIRVHYRGGFGTSIVRLICKSWTDSFQRVGVRYLKAVPSWVRTSETFGSLSVWSQETRRCPIMRTGEPANCASGFKPVQARGSQQGRIER